MIMNAYAAVSDRFSSTQPTYITYVPATILLHHE